MQIPGKEAGIMENKMETIIMEKMDIIIMENQMEKKMENEMETREYMGLHAKNGRLQSPESKRPGTGIVHALSGSLDPPRPTACRRTDVLF